MSTTTIRMVFASLMLAMFQVDEGDLEVINIRETDSRLGPLVYTLVGLGILTLVLTAVFWWLTRPRRDAEIPADDSIGAEHG